MKRSLLQFDDDSIQFNKLKPNRLSYYQDIVDSIVNNCLKTDEISNEVYQTIISIYNKYQILYDILNKDNLDKLIHIICKCIGNECDLNWINVSAITDMSYMFTSSNFNGDISKWDVSNVTDMRDMFSYSKFNGNISKWNVSNVTNMSFMFINSKFNGDISEWDVSNVENMHGMFSFSDFNSDISKWDVSNVENMVQTFLFSSFNKDISSWKVHADYIYGMFDKCKIKKEYKPKFIKK